MTKKRTFHFIASAALLGVVACGIYLYSAWWAPNQRMRDPRGLANASQDEIRSTCHQVLRFPWGCHHDAFLALADIGNSESVALLIRARKWQSPPDKDGSVVCTSSHCVEALRSLTGQTFGFEPEQWLEWWEQTGCTMPATNFYPRNTNESHEYEANNEVDHIPHSAPSAS